MTAEHNVPLVSLLLLGQAIGSITLAAALLWIYRRSPRLLHVWPLAVSYIYILVIASVRLATLQVTATWLQWNLVAAFAIGDAGMIVLLWRAVPRRRP